MTRLPRTAKPIPDAEAQWAHLHAAVPRAHWPWFTWMLALRLTDGTRIDVFLHSCLNRELLLGDDGAAFAMTPSGRYKAHTDVSVAVARALPSRCEWLEMGGFASFDVGPEPWPAGEGPLEELAF